MHYEFYLVFLKNKSRFNILSWLIRRAQNTKYNHVEIMVRSVCGTRQLGSGVSYGAVYPYSRKITYPKLFKKYDLIKLEPIAIVGSEHDAIKELNRLCGRKYSFLQLVVLLFKVLFNELAEPVSKVKLNLDKYLICTELAAIFLEKCAGAKFNSAEALTLKDLDRKWM